MANDNDIDNALDLLPKDLVFVGVSSFVVAEVVYSFFYSFIKLILVGTKKVVSLQSEILRADVA
jgi:hypothetical protein